MLRQRNSARSISPYGSTLLVRPVRRKPLRAVFPGRTDKKNQNQQAFMTHTGLHAEVADVADDAAPAYADLLAENEALRARMDYLIDQATRNHSIMCRHQAFDLEIVSASSFPELIGIIFSTLPKISDLDVVTLTLLDRDSDIHTVMRNLGVDIDAFEASARPGRPARTEPTIGQPLRPQTAEGSEDRRRDRLRSAVPCAWSGRADGRRDDLPECAPSR